ncbi:hypothetical protein N7504_007413 [Penicillium tannophilum]|nr:hypothetical protein N7504_007413 [Penicillium tannophilum]
MFLTIKTTTPKRPPKALVVILPYSSHQSTCNSHNLPFQDLVSGQPPDRSLHARPHFGRLASI